MIATGSSFAAPLTVDNPSHRRLHWRLVSNPARTLLIPQKEASVSVSNLGPLARTQYGASHKEVSPLGWRLL